MLITADRIAVCHARVEDELRVDAKLVSTFRILLVRHIRGFEREQVCLEHMVSIRMCGKFEDELLKLAADGKKFIVKRCWILANDLDQRLDSTGSMDVHRDVDDRGQHCADKLLQVLDLGYLY